MRIRLSVLGYGMMRLFFHFLLTILFLMARSKVVSWFMYAIYGGSATFSIGSFAFVDRVLVSGVISCAGLSLFLVLAGAILVLGVISCAGLSLFLVLAGAILVSGVIFCTGPPKAFIV